MSGPPYPPGRDRSSAPGGQLPVTEQLDYWTTILSQFANSAILTRIIGNIATYVDQRANLDDFYRLIWDLDTAEGYGLDVWGRIVGVNRVLKVQTGSFFGFAEGHVSGLTSITTFNDVQVSYETCIGFAESSPDATPFGQGSWGPAQPVLDPTRENDAEYGPFFTGQSLTDNFRLSDQAYRLLIYAKAAANITDGSIPAINRILISLFPGRGNCYVTEVRPSPFFGFAEAAVTRPTYIRGLNQLQTYDGPFVGFAEGLPDSSGLDQSPFYTGTAQGSPAAGLNALCAPFFSGQDNPYLAMAYTFDFPLTPVELAIVQQSGVLPKPTGVAATVVVN